MKEKINLVEITNELKTSYLDYALSVIISRALPDVRDGLKPVQRRILYTMKELGLWPKEKFTKSANIVGNTLARYHPHGDQAVYDALVRMAQDFSLRYPLVLGQGNFGSIDGDPQAQMRYCVTGDTLVITNRCLERIKEISKEEDVNIKVLSFNKNVNKASKWFDSGIHSVFEIKTFHGYSIKGTKNHPILVLSKNKEGKPIFIWKLIKDLKVGEFAVIDRTDNILWPTKDPLLINYYPQNISRKTQIHKLPMRLNKEIAFILGFIISEGYLVDYKKRGKKIGIINSDPYIVNILRKYLKKTFPTINLYIAKRQPTGVTKREYYSIEICSSFIYQFLNNLGLYKNSAKNKEIPKIIFEGTSKTTAYFLRALFEGDGSLTLGKRNPRIEYISKSEKLIKDLQIILLRFGIVSFIRYDKSKNNFRLFIVGKENITKFYKKINFASPSKKEKLKKILKIYTKKPALSQSDFIPFLSNYIKNKYKNKKIPWVYKKWLEGHNIDRYERLKTNLGILEKFLDEEDLIMIKSFLKLNYLFDKIIFKKYAGKERVYSLKVESNCHSFIGNGFINHNTEAKLSPFAEEMLADIDKDTVDFTPNYDNTRKEPIVLPSRIPQLVLNGALGIAVGMATNIPPHNLKETLLAAKELIKNPDISIKEILSIIKGPDFPTGGVVYGKSSLLNAYKTGKGSIVIRGKVKIEKSKKGKERIIITEIPWQVNKSELVSQIANLALQKILPIKEVRDESNKEGIRVVIELKEGNPEKIIEKIYKLTDLQKRYYFNFIALEDGIQPKLFNIKDLLIEWIKHRKNVIIRRAKFDLEKTKDRIEILEGFKKALDNIDAVIRIIRKSKDKESAKIALMKKLKINERQADAILEMPLRTLTNLERNKILDELKEKLKLKEELEKILKNPKKVDEIIIKDCDELIEKYGDERRTEIIEKELEEKEEEIPVEDILVFINDKKFVTTYKIDTPLEKIIKGEKEIGKIYLAKTTDKIIAYTKKGKFYQIPVKEFYNNPKYLEADLKLEKDDAIIDEFIPKNEKYLLIFTKNGISKKIKIEDALSVKRTGSQAIKLKKDDEVVKSFPKNDGDIFMITKNGFGLCIKDELPLQGRNASGVKAIKIINDELFNASILNKNYLLCIFSNGFFKKISIKEFPIQKRGGKGIKVFDKNEKFGELIFADLINDDEELLIINEKVERIKVKDIPLIKRINQPKKIKDKVSKVYLFKI